MFGLGLGAGCLAVGCVEPPGFVWLCQVLQMSPAPASGQLGVRGAWGALSFVFGCVWAWWVGLCSSLVCLAWVWGLVL